MGAERHRQDPHPRSGHSPKLTVAGRLDGFVNGRPMSIVAEDHQVTIVPGEFGALLELYKIRRSWRSVVGPLRIFFHKANIRLFVRVGWFGRVQFFPDSGLLSRWLLSNS